MGSTAADFVYTCWESDLFLVAGELFYAGCEQRVLLQYRVLFGGNHSVSFYVFDIINMILFRNRSELGAGTNTVAGLRLNKDLEELATKRFSTDYTVFNVSMPQFKDSFIYLPVVYKVKSESGSIYSGAVFDTIIIISQEYPFKPPSILVKNQVYHPNIDIDTGLASLSILKLSDWKPVFTINTIIFAFELVLFSPDFNCIPLNSSNLQMKELYLFHHQNFYDMVKATLQGGWVFEKYFFEYYYGEVPQSKRIRKRSVENTKKFRFNRESFEMNIEICLKNN